MTRLAIISLVALAACHQPTGRFNSGTDNPYGTLQPGGGLSGEAPQGAGAGSAPTIITGTPGDDFLQGTTGPDLINGGAGNDIICGGPCDPALIDRIQMEGW